MPQHVVVVEYRPEWPLAYEKEKERIQKILKENCLALWHIGSTAVPGLAARPVIDMLAAIRSLEDVDGIAEQFALLGYEYLGESGLAGRRYLRKGGDERTHQLHIFKSTFKCELVVIDNLIDIVYGEYTVCLIYYESKSIGLAFEH